MKIMGIDYGDARTGVAISDLLCSIVGSTTVVPSRNHEKLMADLVRLAKENEVGEIVVGLPKNMDGTEGARAELCRAFAEELKAATNLPVAMWDERRTTVEAHNILSAHNYHGAKRKTRWMPWQRPSFWRAIWRLKSGDFLIIPGPCTAAPESR